MDNWGTDYQLPDINTTYISENRTIPGIYYEPVGVQYQVLSNPQYNMEYQGITYVLPKPFVGQKVDITYQGRLYQYTVSSVQYNGAFVESFFVKQSNEIPIQVVIKD